MRAIKLVLHAAVALGIVVAVTAPAEAADARAHRGATGRYLALGDSLAAGFQPDGSGPEEGYVHVLWQTLRRQVPGLGIRNLGCPGETSRSMITGNRSPCSYAKGSQLDAALAFIASHPGQLSLITVNVGPNDVFEACLQDSGLMPRSCVRRVLPEIQARLVRILDALRVAVGPGVPIASMTYYDPLLGAWGAFRGGRVIAHVSLRSFVAMNEAFASTYANEGVTLADVGRRFRIEDFSDTVVVGGRPVPLNVARTCRWTWVCSSDYFGDVHPNRDGYRQIADTFADALEGLVS